MNDKNQYLISLISGGAAGFVVDISLFPLDTLKTRLQSSHGFFKAGGFRNIYKGIGPQIIGSAPTAALFFVTYDSFKTFATPLVSPECLPLVYMSGASISEIVACLIRVPVEVVKQRRQVEIGSRNSSTRIFIKAYQNEGIKGLYRGFFSTVLREVPFSLIQFPLWEGLKVVWSSNLKNGQPLTPWEVAICGAISGGISAAITTPLDVAKTRIILADQIEAKNLKITTVLRNVYKENSIKGLFSGLAPRTLWITLGGAIFFGTYDLVKRASETFFAVRHENGH